MLLIVLLCLIATSAMICNGCYVGILEMTNFNWTLVRINVLTGIGKQVAFIAAPLIYI
jgi:hypothetical protein